MHRIILVNRRLFRYAILSCLLILCSCYTSSRTSKFSAQHIELGMEESAFIKRYGKPFYQETSYTENNRKKETLFYKEELYEGDWFIVTTAFTFIDSKLISQDIVKEERKYNDHDCKK